MDANNCLTMSSFGVTHFIDGQPNFTDLERWQWEHRTFMKILQLKVFRKYRVWKVTSPPQRVRDGGGGSE